MNVLVGFCIGFLVMLVWILSHPEIVINGPTHQEICEHLYGSEDQIAVVICENKLEEL